MSKVISDIFEPGGIQLPVGRGLLRSSNVGSNSI